MNRARCILAVFLSLAGCNFDASGRSVDDAAVADPADAENPADAADLSNLGFRKSLTIDSGLVGADLLDFPMLVQLDTDTSLADHAKDDGSDLLFTDVGGARLSHELEQFDGGTGQLVAWVRVPALSSTADTVIYVYYGDPNASSSEDAVGVWRNSYAGVWHLEQSQTGTGTTGVYTDSSFASNHGEDLVEATGKDGKILGGQQFDGVDDYVKVANPGGSWDFADDGLDVGLSDITVSAWLLYAGSGEGFPTIVKNGAGADNMAGYWVSFRKNDDKFLFNLSDGTSRFIAGSAIGTGLSDAQWHYLSVSTVRGTADTMSFYLDGAPFGVATSTLVAGNSGSGSDFFKIGANHGTNKRAWPGNLDEVRISSVARPPEWVATEFANQNSPSSFYQLGAEEAL